MGAMPTSSLATGPPKAPTARTDFLATSRCVATLKSRIIFAGLKQKQDSAILEGVNGRHAYFVHSYRATESPDNKEWVLATSEYGGDFISAVKKGEVSRQPLVCGHCS